MLMTARSRAAASTYLMARRSLLAPYLMSAVAGTWAHVPSASYLLGGALQSSTHADDDEIALLANHPIAQGTHDYRLLHNTFTTKPIVALDVNGAEEAAVDQYGGSAANVISEDSFTLGAKSAALSLRTSDKNASSTDYYASAQMGEVVKTSDGGDWGSGPEDLPWYQDIPPWFYSATTSTASSFWGGSTNYAFGGFGRLADNDGEYTEYRIFCPATANYQLVVLYGGATWQANMEVSVDGGSTLDSHDTYSGSTTYNNVATLDLGELSAGWHTVRLTSDDSASPGVRELLRVNWIQLQRTSVGTCPAGVNGPEQVLLLPTFSDSETGTWTLSISINQVLYGWMYAVTASASKSWSENLKAGTYRARVCGVRYSDGATTVTAKLNGSSVGTFSQNGATSYGHVWDVTGITVPTDGKHTFLLELTAGTTIYLGSVLLERTGD